MNNFPEFLSLPLSDWVDALMDWLLLHFAPLFDFIGEVGLAVLLSVERALLWLPWYIVIIGTGILAWKAMGKIWTAVLMALLLMVIGSFGYWDLAMMTLAIVITSVAVSLLIGIPTGILMAWNDRFRSFLRPVLDAMQTMPSFVYLIPALMFFGLGKVPATFATIIYAVPPVIRLTNVGIREVPKDVIEAAKAFGSNRKQILFECQLPLAKPSIMVGINQTTMMALAMVVVGSMIGAKGLGLEVLLAINRIEIGRGFEAGLSVVILAIIIDRITSSFAKKKQNTAAAAKSPQAQAEKKETAGTAA